jgi:hypothetical protein
LYASSCNASTTLSFVVLFSSFFIILKV